MKTELYNYLLESSIVTEEEMSLVTSINGDNLETYQDILHVRTGYKSLEQLEES